MQVKLSLMYPLDYHSSSQSHIMGIYGLHLLTSYKIRFFNPGAKEYLTELAAPDQIQPLLASVESFNINLSFQNASYKTVFWASVFKVTALCNWDVNNNAWKATTVVQ